MAASSRRPKVRNPSLTVATHRSLAGRFADVLGSRAFVVLCLVVVGACIAYVNMLPIINPDFGWHVAVGRYIYENKTIPTTETFSHTARGNRFVPHEWLSELCYYLVIQAAGVLGVRWLHTGLALLILLIVYFLLRRHAVEPALALFGAFLYFVIANGRFHARPHVFDMLFLIVMYGYLFIGKPHLHGWQLAGIFLYVVVWANFHSGVVLIAAIVLLYLAVEAFQRFTGWRRPQPDDLGRGDLRRLAILAGLVVVGVFVTPGHYHLLHYIAESKRINAEWSREWQSIVGYWNSPMMKPLAVPAYWLVLISTGAFALLTIRRASLASLTVIVFLAILPLTGQRFVGSMFAPVIFVIHQLHQWLQGPSPRRQVAHRFACAFAPLIVLALVIPVMGTDLEVPDVHIRSPEGRVFDKDHWAKMWDKIALRLRSQHDFQRNYFPVGAVTFLDELNLQGRLFNSSDWGGYILFRMYEKYPIFMDGRWVDYGERTFKDSLAIEKHWKNAYQKLDEYAIDILLVHRDWMKKGLPKVAGTWVLVFENFNASVFIRNSPANAANLDKCADYYRQRRIPFGKAAGFNEQAAFRANANWANRMRVQQKHLAMGQYPAVNGW